MFKEKIINSCRNRKLTCYLGNQCNILYYDKVNIKSAKTTFQTFLEKQKEINQPEEVNFCMRIVTISYAKIYGPSCGDLEGLHESMMPSTSIVEIHRKNVDEYNVCEVFRAIDKSRKPVFVPGTVALGDRDAITEPQAKRCYFAALVAVTMKRDLIQNPLSGMVDKVLELADGLYKLFEQPKLHTEHILRDVGLMGRAFDLRDSASPLISLLDENGALTDYFLYSVKKQLTQFLKKCTSGIIQFSNCCYGFWYSEATKHYYYLDPYQCDCKGRRVSANGNGCLGIFASVCSMAAHMCVNRFTETTGFFVHRVHVESVNSPPRDKFLEDPIWIYLDYHWSHRHAVKSSCQKKKKKKRQERLLDEEAKKPTWKNYLIEIPGLIYSLWGTVGSFEPRFRARAGKNQAAIAVALFAMRDLCHPSDWSSVVLDSAVLCGDCYHRDSCKALTRCLNRFNLMECMKISPFVWNMEFKSDICGMLYGGKNLPSILECVEKAFARSSNALLQCQKKILAILRTSDAYYAADSSWTGPPLFSKNRGAMYTIRCKNVNTLVYVLTKMLNTNQKLEFVVTPVKIVFKEETCQSSDTKPRINRKKILEKPVHSAPGQTLDPSILVDGSVTVTDEDSYLCYSRNLKLGLTHGAEYENTTESVTEKSAKMIGKTREKKLSARDSKVNRKCLETVHESKVQDTFSRCISNILERNLSYPRVLNLAKRNSKDSVYDEFSCAGQPVEIRRSFVYDESRQLFEKYNAEMDQEIRIPRLDYSTTQMSEISHSTTLNIVIGEKYGDYDSGSNDEIQRSSVQLQVNDTEE